MKFDECYKVKLPLYKRGRSAGPGSYTYKKDGFRIQWIGTNKPCFFCKDKTNWGLTYFYPSDRFREWHKRKVSTFYICKEEEITLCKTQILEDKINGEVTMQFVPNIRYVK